MHLRSPSLLLTSLALNAVLAGSLSWYVCNRSAPQPLPTPLVAEQAAPTPAKPAPFHWKQIDSPDFATFVRNLRGIGCPEATIRHIVQAELQQVYLEKRQQLQAALTTLPQGTERAKLQQEFQLLDQEEAQVLQSLVEAQGAPKAEMPKAAAAVVDATAAPAPKKSIATIENIPTAFLVGDDPSESLLSNLRGLSVIPTDPQLPPETAQVINTLRNDFANALGDSAKDPNSPIYKKKWATARRDSDEFFASMYGGDAYIRIQLEASQRAAAEAAAQGK